MFAISSDATLKVSFVIPICAAMKRLFCMDKPLFAKLDGDQRAMVASIMQHHSFAAGETLMAEGENGDTFFIIGAGTCSVNMAGRHLKDLPVGTGFGEIALIYNQPRTSTVVAKTAVEA